MKKRLLVTALLPIVMVAILASCGKKENGHEYVDLGLSENGHEYVDLGLSVKWATCNVGADSPMENGDSFAWGETSPKKDYSWETYKWTKGYNPFTKYCTDPYYGKKDNKTTLDLSDDAAHVNWGGKWRMPTEAEYEELIENCTWEWTTIVDVNGYIVTSKINGNSIFLPAEGSLSDGTNLNSEEDFGSYWSSSLDANNCVKAYNLSFGSNDVGFDFNHHRDCGNRVRAVCE